jgi:hypothetical protein
VEFSAPSWSSDTTGVVSFTVAESTGTITVGADPASGTKVRLVLFAGGETNIAVITLAKVDGGWRVVSVAGESGGATVYDAAFVKSMLADSTSG